MKRKFYQLAIIIVSLFIIHGLSRSLIELSAQKKRIGKVKEDMVKLEKEEQELLKQLKYYQSEEYVEAIARDKLLLSLSGETVIVLPDEANKDLRPLSFIPQPSEAEPQLPNWKKWAKLFGF